MAKVSDRHIKQLRPYLIGEDARPNGEWDMYCPLHSDGKRSASLNVLTGQWYCFAGCGGGNIIDLIRARSRWVSPGVAATNGHSPRRNGATGETPAENISMAKIEGWHSALLSEETALDDLVTKRGIHTKTIMDFKIGYDLDQHIYTIPIFGPEGPTGGEIWNVRRYNMYPAEGKRKIWSVAGMRATELYPIWLLENLEDVEILGGEWDTLLTIQNGYGAITRTGAEDVWRNEWNEHFKGKRVYLGHDKDAKGYQANRKVGR